MTSKQYKEWYESVDFIQNNMQFYSVDDFLHHSVAIKSMYNAMDRRTKKMYQWYLFANYLNYNQKCLIWDYINNVIEYPEFIYLIRLAKNKEIINVEQRTQNENKEQLSVNVEQRIKS